MARKRRGTRRVVAVAVVYCLVVYGLWLQREWLWLVVAVLVLLGAPFVAVMFVRWTTCDVSTRAGNACRNEVRGRFRGCRKHRREKAAYWWARFGFHRRAARTLPVPLRADVPPARAGSVRRRIELPVTVEHELSATVTFVCTLVTTAATVISTTIAVFGAVGVL